MKIPFSDDSVKAMMIEKKMMLDVVGWGVVLSAVFCVIHESYSSLSSKPRARARGNPPRQ
jgi:hypothetical protein